MWRSSGPADPACAQVLLYEPGLPTENLYGAAHSLSGTMGTCDHPTESGNRSHWLGHLRTLGFSLGFSSQYWDLADEYLATSHEACHEDDRQGGASGGGRLLVPAWQNLWHSTGGSATAPDQGSLA